MSDDDTKRCSKCWQYLPPTDFDEDRRTRDRLSYRCHHCRHPEPQEDDQ